MRKRKFYYVFRSAVTGSFVSRKFADRNPCTTIRERRVTNVRKVKRAKRRRNA
jgi:hypothetical protein